MLAPRVTLLITPNPLKGRSILRNATRKPDATVGLQMKLSSKTNSESHVECTGSFTSTNLFHRPHRLNTFITALPQKLDSRNYLLRAFVTLRHFACSLDWQGILGACSPRFAAAACRRSPFNDAGPASGACHSRTASVRRALAFAKGIN
jgi:hypothetical protein